MCWTAGDWQRIVDQFAARGARGLADARAFVSMPQNIINLSPPICESLDDISHHGLRPESRASAKSISTLAHEAMHVAAIENETVAECYAAQLTTHTSELLGTETAFSTTMGTINWERYIDEAPATGYFNARCHDGGGLDLDHARVTWP